ncbi:glycoside hydrolase family 3 protein [Spiractinospora alimapuensis]|uniref:glycoside hydrolase family 3 N-terminal domain-containing protein n=1 Tax=Spiractinospora alimapuensis TaxID=2820884 RepID=UPI001F336DA1|nr:glycoside hydrolase family 3 N-terminal domain-containing protein [Spiractinospora alimapuensis]QVQ53637.1 glycoside hydrolase family 3 protein [Spiractinospora alimapuensis]
MHTDPSLERLVNATLLPSFANATPPRWLLDALDSGVGGVCLFSNNITGPEQLTALTRQLRDAGAATITLDEEGGDVTRIAHDTGSNYPGNCALGAIDDPDLTRSVMRSMGLELRGLGVTLDLAPSVDVNVADDNPTIGTRSFGSDPEVVARQAAAAIAGLQEAGVAACAKHFPGHGATRTDSHTELPIVDGDADLLARRDLLPFVAAIDAGVRAVLTAHIQFPGLGVTGPATHAPAIVTGLLRDQLGFAGTVITDALEMKGASGEIGVPEAAVRAIAAGCDLLCLGRWVFDDDVAAVRHAIVEAVREGRIPGERLESAARRSTELGTELPSPATGGPDTEVSLVSARRAIRVDGELPALDDPYVVELDAPPMAAVGQVPWGLGSHFPASVRRDAARTTAEEIATGAGERTLVLVLRDAHRFPRTRDLVQEVCALRSDVVVVEMGFPVWRPDARAYVRTYGASRVNARGAAEVLRAGGDSSRVG